MVWVPSCGVFVTGGRGTALKSCDSHAPDTRRRCAVLGTFLRLGCATALVFAAGAVAVTSGATEAVAQGPTSVPFSYTGGAQTWTVPTGVTSVQVTAVGAQGGGSYGGLGSQVVATIPVTPGQTLGIYVGGQDSSGTTGGYNGGGAGGYSGSDVGYGGGGASDVRLGGTTLADRVVVAGGGGGIGSYGAPTKAPGARVARSVRPRPATTGAARAQGAAGAPTAPVAPAAPAPALGRRARSAPAVPVLRPPTAAGVEAAVTTAAVGAARARARSRAGAAAVRTTSSRLPRQWRTTPVIPPAAAR